jgi:hypothetical protein
MSLTTNGQPSSALSETTSAWLRQVPAITWLMFIFALLVLAGGFMAMAFITNVRATAIAALVTAVLGVVGTHAGHVAGHQLALKKSETSRAPDDAKPS